jgi:hypothetical protein
VVPSFGLYGLKHLFKYRDTVELIPETQTMSAIGALIQRVGFQTEVVRGKFMNVIIYGLAFAFGKLNFVMKTSMVI